MFKAGADIEIGRNMGTVHVCPYVGEVTRDLRGGYMGGCTLGCFYYPKPDEYLNGISEYNDYMK